MRTKLLSVVAGGGLALGLLAAPAFAQDDPNQGNPDLVLTVDNPAVSCEDPMPLEKVEGDLGTTISFSAQSPIDKVTVKSGSKAEVVSATFSASGPPFTGTITLTQDVSNYVIWVCEPTPTTTPPTTPPTTTTTTTPTTPPTTTTTTTTPTTTTTTPPGGGGMVTPGPGAPDTGGSDPSTPFGGLIGGAMLLAAGGLLAADILRRRGSTQG
jgi:hypothetical protein